jgi:thioredoxin reductase
MDIHPVIIIGAGPAGLAAAMQLERQGISPLVFERQRVGGLLWNANWVENYPGFVEGITGPNLVKLFHDQALRLGVKIILDKVIKAEFQDGLFRIATKGVDHQSNLLVAASGTVPKEYSLETISEGIKERVFSEVGPISHVQEKQIIIIGAGDAALDYALNLSRLNKVTILNRGNQIRGLKLLWERVQKKTAISYFNNIEIINITLDDEGELLLSGIQEGEEVTLAGDYLITAVGRTPEFSFAGDSIIEGRDQLVKDQKLFLIGDLINGSFRQTSIAVADGIRTAMIIGDLLEKG